ncbi:hypothetical protein EVAR_93031_1 [Eumeta japonica]|uniref:Uncharacterized protein n=1 Tax=Eumeta variegata TaxID=151549 RepID=A0A4C1SER4_EUMVA|nr:hypothetical protein EVAR_93031_1 [Eumeta japonica]
MVRRHSATSQTTRLRRVKRRVTVAVTELLPKLLLPIENVRVCVCADNEKRVPRTLILAERCYQTEIRAIRTPPQREYEGPIKTAGAAIASAALSRIGRTISAAARAGHGPRCAELTDLHAHQET